ncbi:MAG: hypothetical protein ACLP50_33290 [Solirubrobacteraceae bacterium]
MKDHARPAAEIAGGEVRKRRSLRAHVAVLAAELELDDGPGLAADHAARKVGGDNGSDVLAPD